MRKLSICWLIFLSLVLYFPLVAATGNVWLVLGSDTAIWDGMSTNRYNCTYNLSLYTDPAQNANKVMDPAFRAQMVDSYGTPLKMTWWMMAGNIFRFASNRDLPVPNVMTLHLMQKYYGENATQIGDELSLHYHTFFWSDYDGDGRFYWNQSKTFLECRDDFDVTLAQFLIEENVMPVTFRSGWHYMDNGWQDYLNQILPYCYHNDWPAKRLSDPEPIDNIFDWSQAPQAFVPFQPAPENYQLPGGTRGWNVRSMYTGNATAEIMGEIFAQANQGINQVACVWSHLPETDFPQQLQRVHANTQAAAAKYPDVKFRYCTGIEAMQRWLGTTDFTAPELTVNLAESGGEFKIQIQTSEPIFQPAPIVAVKDIYEQYQIVPCVPTGENQWETQNSFTKNLFAKIGVSVCDTVGNQSNRRINILPDDIFVDNTDPGYQEISGAWSTLKTVAWNQEARLATPASGAEIRARWQPEIESSGRYNIFVQVPTIPNPIRNFSYLIVANGVCVDTVHFSRALTAKEWNYLGTVALQAGGSHAVELVAQGETSARTAAADVVKFSALVRERDLCATTDFINLDEVSQDDSTHFSVTVRNQGLQEVRIEQISSVRHLITNRTTLPLILPAGKAQNLALFFWCTTPGSALDTLEIHSNDPGKPVLRIPVAALVAHPFEVVDDLDSTHYSESGEWHFSVANAFKATSRFANLGQNPPAAASFYFNLKRSGIYEIQQIVPETINSADRARYILKIGGFPVDSILVNQNQGSGAWVTLWRTYLPANLDVEVRVEDSRQNTTGPVLRADAIKMILWQELTKTAPISNLAPREFLLEQNYPNPFNNSTRIRFQVPYRTQVKIDLFNLAGQQLETLVDAIREPGMYEIGFNADRLASGIYFYRMQTDKFLQVKKMTLLK